MSRCDRDGHDAPPPTRVTEKLNGATVGDYFGSFCRRCGRFVAEPFGEIIPDGSESTSPPLYPERGAGA